MGATFDMGKAIMSCAITSTPGTQEHGGKGGSAPPAFEERSGKGVQKCPSFAGY